MNDRFEDRLTDTLDQRAGDVTDAPDLADRAVAVGRRARRRRRILAAVVTASLVAAISIATVELTQRTATGPAPIGPANRPTTPAEDLPGVKPTAVPTPSATEIGTVGPQTRRVTRCRDIPTDEPPQNHGTDTTFEPETGFIEIWYTVAGRNRHHTIDYRHDKTCADHRPLRKLINGVVATAIADGVEAMPPPWQLIPAKFDHPAAGICGGNDGPVAILNLNPDTPAPRCLVVRPDQRLKVVNTTDRFGFTGTTVIVTFGPWPSRTLDVGESVTFDQPLGKVFAPGAHTVHLDFQGGYDGGEILVE